MTTGHRGRQRLKGREAFDRSLPLPGGHVTRPRPRWPAHSSITTGAAFAFLRVATLTVFILSVFSGNNSEMHFAPNFVAHAAIIDGIDSTSFANHLANTSMEGRLESYFERSYLKTPTPKPMPLISRNMPAFSSSDYSSDSAANYANDEIYGFWGTAWRSNSTPAWLAYDVSGVAESRRGKVVVALYNDTGGYDHTIWCQATPHNIPSNYVIEANAAVGRTSQVPNSGWTTLTTVTGNRYSSRQHVLDLTGFNWIRVRVSDVIGGPDVRFNMDIHDASLGVEDDWIFFGDSLTAGGMDGSTRVLPPPLNLTFAQHINRTLNDHYPVQQNGGIVCNSTDDGAKYIPVFLQDFPGKYVAVSYGTNDASNGASPIRFYSNYASMIQAILDTGKTPIVPKIPWARTAAVQANAPELNAMIDRLYDEFPQVVHGPDLWTYFRENPSLINDNDVHLTNEGYAHYRQLWAQTMLDRVYQVTTVPATATPTPTATASAIPRFSVPAVRMSAPSGQPASFAARATSDIEARARVNWWAWDGSGAMFAQGAAAPTTFPGGRPVDIPIQVPAPPTGGVVTVKMQISAEDWSAVYAWIDPLATIDFTAAATPTPTATPAATR